MRECQRESVERKKTSHQPIHAPAHHATRGQIEDYREREPAHRGWERGDVGHPYPIDLLVFGQVESAEKLVLSDGEAVILKNVLATEAYL